MNILNKIIKSRGFKQFIVEVCIGDTLFTKWFTLKENNA